MLVVSYTKPYSPVLSSTIARWLKETLGAAGVDTSIFKAHSVREASPSAASKQGVTTDDTLNTVDWSSESSFQCFTIGHL